LTFLVPPLIVCFLLLTPSGLNVGVTPGVMRAPPSGYYAYNLDPLLNSTENGPIYDPNFIPGFRVGLTNTSLHWDTGLGYARIGYQVGPWKTLQVALPHLAVGPQCCNFQEIPRTQQYRAVDWGDYYYVKAGFAPPGVNVPNFTTNFNAPAYVGLRTDWPWRVSISLDWTPPNLLNLENRWAAIGITATQYVPNAPNKLVYTVVNFWMDDNSSAMLGRDSSSNGSMIASSHVVVYHPLQLSATGNQTVTVDLTPYLENTLEVLNFTATTSNPPVISYVYLNIEGYNMEWNTTLYSFFVMSDHNPSIQTPQESPSLYYAVAVLVIAVATALVLYVRTRRRS